MGKNLISIVAVATMVFTVWVLFLRSPEPVSSDGLSTPIVVVPESAAPAAELPMVDVLPPTGNSNPNRSAMEQPTPEVSVPEPSVAAPAPQSEHEHGSTFIEVLVVDIANKPIGGARVLPNEAGEGLPFLPSSRIAGSRLLMTNEQGLITMAPDIDGLVRMVATAEGFAPGSSEVFELGAADTPKRVTVTLTAGGSAEGQLLDIHGEPAEDVPISIHLAQWPGTIGKSRSNVAQYADTAEDGSFLFENLTPGKYNLYTRAKGERLETVPIEWVVLEVKEGERTVVQFAAISESFVRLDGVVIRNSEPLANAGINIHWADRSRGYQNKSTRTDDEGRFTIVLDEGARYRFQISPKGRGGSVFREIEIPSVESHEVEISFDTGSISGFLLGPNGEPVEGLKITAFGSSAVEGSGSTVQSTVSQAEGAFEFIDLVDGSYKLVAKTISNMPEPAAAPKYPYLGSAELKDLELKAGEFREGVQLQMSGAAAVDGTVTDEEGKPVARAAVEFRGDSPLDNSQWRADKSGMFLAGGLKPGHYVVRASRQRQISPWVSIQVKAQATTSVDGLVLQAGSLIDIEALMGSESAGRIYARIHSEDGRRADSKVFRDGKGQLGPVLPGTYTVTVKQVGGEEREASQTLTVDGEPSLTVQIDLL